MGLPVRVPQEGPGPGAPSRVLACLLGTPAPSHQAQRAPYGCSCGMIMPHRAWKGAHVEMVCHNRACRVSIGDGMRYLRLPGCSLRCRPALAQCHRFILQVPPSKAPAAVGKQLRLPRSPGSVLGARGSLRGPPSARWPTGRTLSGRMLWG